MAAASKLAELLNGPITEKPLNISHKVHAEVQGGLAGDVILADTREGICQNSVLTMKPERPKFIIGLCI
ncbi:MAG: hypothetical protein O2921_07255 [Chloroflexi bacterium]|nr:hypothetical protein [Chloroflexota bacterium]MDA1282404.1 hypothetical protein [Chloroflexota bacterium]